MTLPPEVGQWLREYRGGVVFSVPDGMPAEYVDGMRGPDGSFSMPGADSTPRVWLTDAGLAAARALGGLDDGKPHKPAFLA